jgi:hypothetical protein
MKEPARAKRELAYGSAFFVYKAIRRCGHQPRSDLAAGNTRRDTEELREDMQPFCRPMTSGANVSAMPTRLRKFGRLRRSRPTELSANRSRPQTRMTPAGRGCNEARRVGEACRVHAWGAVEVLSRLPTKLVGSCCWGSRPHLSAPHRRGLRHTAEPPGVL